MKVKLLKDDPYGELICQYFAQTFNKVIQPDTKQMLEILTLILIGDKNTRLGPVPSPESLVVIRSTIIKALELNAPIPILVAWGGRKTIASKGVDVAEVAALGQLMRLQDSIRKYYPPGVYINIRIEDTGADWIYRHEKNIQEHVASYSFHFSKLVKMLCNNYNIIPIRESKLMNRPEYFEVSRRYSKLLESIIKARILNEGKVDLNPHSAASIAMDELIELGWKGELPMTQIDHYIERYKTLYPGLSMDNYILMAADYLGGAKARYDLNGRAEPKSVVGSWIAISFIAPIPGAPQGMFANNLYYRTVPANQGRTHIAPWRAKGYLSIEADNTVNIKVTSWNNGELMDELNVVEAILVDGEDEVTINTDYVVKDSSLPLVHPMM